MGVKNLWTLLSDVCENDIDISSLHGKTLAVDLSCWICELKKIPIAQTISNLFLVNLFYRTTHFLKHGIKLVFVEDGIAPEIKKSTLLQRNKGSNTSLERKGLQKVTKQCRELLQLLGLPCLQSDGEADVLCALLSSNGTVDGVLTSDSDALLYGAKKVYRKLKMDTNSIDCCDMDVVEKELKLDRKGLVTMALLCGCDYLQDGVHDVGIRKAQDFIKLCLKLDEDPLDRVKNWRTNRKLKNLQELRQSPSKKKSHCTQCKHLGTKSDHFKNGCESCDSEQSCDINSGVSCQCESCCIDHNKLELNLREKALKNPAFPDQEVIDEYLNSGQDKPVPSLEWNTVNVSSLKIYIQHHTSWKDQKFFNKISELLIILHINGMDWAVSDRPRPKRIVRKSILKKTPSVIVEWSKFELDTVTDDHYVVTVSEEKFTKLYPQMMEEYNRKQEEEKQQKLKKKKKKGNKREKPEEQKVQKSITDHFPIVKKAKLSSNCQ